MKRINKDLKEIILARLATMQDDYQLIIGQEKAMGKKELIKQVKEETEFGKKVAEMELTFMKDMVRGKIYKALGQ